MSEELIVYQCAPTLAGMKTGSLFPCPYTNRREITHEIRRFNQKYVRKGLCLLPLRFCNNRVLLWLFRPDQLKEDLNKPLASSILEECGYSCRSYGECITALVRRFSEIDTFPHEIGLFIGYPPADVDGFIRNKAQNYKVSGLWKVYDDEKYACALFQKYKRCTESYCSLWKSGCNLEKLTG